MRFGKRARGVVRYGAILAIGYSQHLFIRDLQLYQVLGFLLAREQHVGALQHASSHTLFLERSAHVWNRSNFVRCKTHWQIHYRFVTCPLNVVRILSLRPFKIIAGASQSNSVYAMEAEMISYLQSSIGTGRTSLNESERCAQANRRVQDGCGGLY